jgi:hypothetical protein
MSSYSQPRVNTYKADGAIPKGSAVKIGTDKQHVAKSTATTDKSVGIAMNAAAAAEDLVEVALPGGGGKALAQTTIAAGKLLVPHTDGSLKPVSGANDRFIAMATDDAVAGDLVQVEVVVGQATATES